MKRFVVAAALLLGLLATGHERALAQGAFYDAPESDAVGRPGTLVRREPMAGAPDGAAAWRILYRSTGLDGRPILVSGVVIVQRDPPPPGGRQIVAWAHPTSGIVPRCAPSLAIFFFQQVQGLKEMVKRGYVVVATDYPGLGTPGPHPYLVGDSEGRAVLDSVRAAREIPEADAGKRYVVWGHSQGGQAALYAGLLAHDYAPELDLAGIAVAAPATDLARLMRDDIETVGGKNLTAMTLWSWNLVFHAPIDRVVEPTGMASVDGLAEECIESIFDLFVRRDTGKPLARSFLSVPDVTVLEPWRGLLEHNTPGLLPHEIPVFIAQGDKDDVVRPQVTFDYMASLCRDGSRVRLFVMPGEGHAFAARDSADEAVAWMADRFAGGPAPTDCKG